MGTTGITGRTGLEQYCPHKPWPRQRAFLDLECEEALYGGAAGPGKTDGLLMAALQFVHVPKYSALILRRDFQRLALPGAIMDRARQWLYGTDAQWNAQARLYRFPSGATLQFGYIDSPEDRFRYASSEFQFIGWDELTEFRLNDDDSNVYQFMFSRLRKTVDMPVPLRMRSATNPGNVGHEWVKRRFVTAESMQALTIGGSGVFYSDAARKRAFVPALMRDNPAINPEEYEATLSHLPPVTRERLKRGDWTVREDGLIKVEWLRYYGMKGEIICLLDRYGRQIAVFDQRECTRFATADTAGTSAEKAKESRGRSHSWSVLQVWDRAPARVGPFLMLRHVWRKRVEFPALLEGFREVYRDWRPSTFHVEDKHFGPAVCQVLQSEMPMRTISTGTNDKITRAAPLMNAMERGEIFIPEFNNDWKPDFESELLAWTGLDSETDDQIDAAAHAVASQGVTRGAWGGVIMARR